MSRKKTISPFEGIPKWIIDFGNAWLKAVVGLMQIMIPHAMAEITEAEYLVAMRDLENSDDRWDYFKFSGKHYVVGACARKYEVRRQGRSKYERSYMAPFVARVAIEYLRKAENPTATMALLRDAVISAWASHPPQDAEFSGQLSKALKGIYLVEAADGMRFKFEIGDVKTYYEAFGSYQYMLFNDPDLLQGSVGLFDFGGGTLATLKIGANGIIVPGSGRNTETGVNDARERLRGLIEHNHRDIFAQGHVDPVRLDNALMTGVYKAGGYGDIPVEAEVKQALAPLLNDTITLYASRFNNGLDVDTLILTGGGTALLHKRVGALLNHRAVIPAIAKPHEKVLDYSMIQFSNTLGPRAFLDALEAEGVGK